jgi:hypothetical protein
MSASGSDCIETPAGPLRVVRSDRAAGDVDVGDLVAIVAADHVAAAPRLLELPTVRRLARAGRRSIVLVPLAEVLAVFAATS